jgi:hypothetical protein
MKPSCNLGSTEFSCVIEVGTSGTGPAANITGRRIRKRLQKLVQHSHDHVIELSAENVPASEPSMPQANRDIKPAKWLFKLQTRPSLLLRILDQTCQPAL